MDDRSRLVEQSLVYTFRNRQFTWLDFVSACYLREAF